MGADANKKLLLVLAVVAFLAVALLNLDFTPEVGHLPSPHSTSPAKGVEGALERTAEVKKVDGEHFANKKLGRDLHEKEADAENEEGLKKSVVHRHNTGREDVVSDPDGEDPATVLSQKGNTGCAGAKKVPHTRRPGRDGVDHSHRGLRPGPEGVNHAWGAEEYLSVINGSVAQRETDICFGVEPQQDCLNPEAVDYFRKHVLMGIATGKEGSFRVEVSQCTWLSHFPSENIFVFTDVMPEPPMTPHSWIEQGLPDGICEKDGDVFSDSVKTGYIKQVRNAGMGYSAGWIVAQFRFGTGIQHMLDVAMTRESDEDPNNDIRWILLVDDDTLVNINNLYKRFKPMDYKKPWYLSRTGWGGAGHFYSLGAMNKFKALKKVKWRNPDTGKDEDKEMTGLEDCIYRWFVRSFRASDTMLLKCGRHLGMNVQKEATMSHCPASTNREKLIDERQITFHGKKDYYPPVLLTTFRTNLYYRAMYCRDRKAMELAVSFSSCAYGSSCKSSKCTKAFDSDREKRWIELSKNNTLTRLPWKKLGIQDRQRDGSVVTTKNNDAPADEVVEDQ